MTKKEILFLLAPVIPFLCVAFVLFFYADFYAPSEKDQLRAMQQKKVAEMVQKIESGEYPQKLEVILAAVYHQEHDIQDIASDLRFNSGHDRLTFKSLEKTDGKQLQSLRELRPESAIFLQMC